MNTASLKLIKIHGRRRASGPAKTNLRAPVRRLSRICGLLSLLVMVALSGCALPEVEGTPTAATANPADKSPIKVKAAAKPELTKAQRNARRSAESYIELTGFSRKGLITQLSQFDGYSKADATKAVDSLNLDYKKQAVRTARSYLDLTGFSRKGLTTQLSQFDYYTKTQAEYAVNKVGL